MILYIDETENQDYFIVAGLLAESQLVVDNSFRHLKNRINKLNYKAKDKNEIFLEFKGHVLDRKFQKVKFEMLDVINKLDEVIYYSCYIKKEKSLKQSIKEKEYIRMLEKIVSNIADDIDIIFDNFNKKDFEMKIVERIGSKDNVRSIKPMKNQDQTVNIIVDKDMASWRFAAGCTGKRATMSFRLYTLLYKTKWNCS